MIDFSAFPTRKPQKQLWMIIPSLLVCLCLLVSILLMTQPGGMQRLGFNIFQVVVAAIITVSSVVVLIVIPIWFMRDVLFPRINALKFGLRHASVPAYNNIPPVQKFSSDNGFDFVEYPFGTPAKNEYYTDFINKRDGDDVYILYELAGKNMDTNFKFYCLAFADGKRSIGIIERRALAHSKTEDGRRIEYVTVLSTDRPIVARNTREIKVANSINNQGYIYCIGQANDRKTLIGMFRMLGM